MELVHADDRSRLRAELDSLTEETAAVRRVDVRCLRPDDSWLWVELTLANLVDDPVVAGVALHAGTEYRRAPPRLLIASFTSCSTTH